MIGKKVKAGEVVGVLKAIVGNAAFIEVEPNVSRIVHATDVVVLGTEVVQLPEPASLVAADPAPEVIKAPKKPRKKKAPKAPE